MKLHCLLYICFNVALSYAIPEIMVTSDNPGDPLSIRHSGSVSNVITDEERELLELSDARLINAGQAVFNNRPNSVHLRDPTPWGFHYIKYGWPEVQCRLSVLKADYDFTDAVAFLSNFTYNVTENMARGADISFTLNSKEENIIQSEWWGTQTVSFNKRISYGVLVARGQFSFSMTNNWGEGHVERQRINIRASTSADFRLPVGETVFVELLATRRHLNLNIDYLTDLSGSAFVNFARQHNGHHFWRSEINHLLQTGGYPVSAVTGERLKLGFLIDARLRFSDARSRRVLQQIPAVIEIDNEK